VDDAFDALLATTIFLLTAAYSLQAAVIQRQPNPTLNGYEEQLVDDTIRLMAQSPQLLQEINGSNLKTWLEPNQTVVVLAAGEEVALQPPTQISGQLTVCETGPEEGYTQTCSEGVVGGDPHYTSCYTEYAAINGSIVKVTACLA